MYRFEHILDAGQKLLFKEGPTFSQLIKSSLAAVPLAQQESVRPHLLAILNEIKTKDSDFKDIDLWSHTQHKKVDAYSEQLTAIADDAREFASETFRTMAQLLAQTPSQQIRPELFKSITAIFRAVPQRCMPDALDMLAIILQDTPAGQKWPDYILSYKDAFWRIGKAADSHAPNAFGDLAKVLTGVRQGQISSSLFSKIVELTELTDTSATFAALVIVLEKIPSHEFSTDYVGYYRENFDRISQIAENGDPHILTGLPAILKNVPPGQVTAKLIDDAINLREKALKYNTVHELDAVLNHTTLREQISEKILSDFNKIINATATESFHFDDKGVLQANDFDTSQIRQSFIAAKEVLNLAEKQYPREEAISFIGYIADLLALPVGEGENSLGMEIELFAAREGSNCQERELRPGLYADIQYVREALKRSLYLTQLDTNYPGSTCHLNFGLNAIQKANVENKTHEPSFRNLLKKLSYVANPAARNLLLASLREGHAPHGTGSDISSGNPLFCIDDDHMTRFDSKIARLQYRGFFLAPDADLHMIELATQVVWKGLDDPEGIVQLNEDLDDLFKKLDIQVLRGSFSERVEAKWQADFGYYDRDLDRCVGRVVEQRPIIHALLTEFINRPVINLEAQQNAGYVDELEEPQRPPLQNFYDINDLGYPF